jgi:GntR family transcriptional regulator/MocR family aminotransferase
MQTDYLKDKNAGAIYVTPSHQFPLGGILPAVRRSALIRYARETGIYIIEDDYDSEFRYSGAPISPLYSMDPEKVIYVGTFSKSVFPALRIGFILLPEALHTDFGRLRIYHDVQNPIFEQAALAEFLRSRNYDRHVRRMRKVYSSRRIELLNLLKEYFKDSYQVWGDAAGLHMAVSFPGKHFNYEFVKESKMMGLHLTTVDYHSIEKGKHTDKLLLGYGHLSNEKLREGVAILYKLIMN